MLLCSIAVFAAAVAQVTVVPVAVPSSLSTSTGIAIPAATPVHLGISLRFPAPAAVEALLARQQDPSSPDYRRWLTAAEFGERFGQPTAVYGQAARWLEAGGFSVSPSPNRLFIEGQGSAAQVQALLGLHLTQVPGSPVSVHVPDAMPSLPPFLQGVVVGISGLDTRIRYHHRLLASDGGTPSFGPQDLRRFYDSQALLDEGYVGQNQKLVVLSEAETVQDAPSQVAIEYYFRNISDSSAVFSEVVLPNPQGDFDQEGGGGGTEFALDSEMQSVGAPGAESITLVVPPASEVFTTGANYIVNQLDSATAVSVSLGLCELGVEETEDGVVTTMQQFLEQGLIEGQTWSAATGDNGADDCRDGRDVAVDFPASIPQMVAVGGTELATPSWDPDSALTAYQQETGWNAGNGGGAGGGGVSVLYPLPSYQTGAPFKLDGGRSLPDMALIAGSPGVLIDDPIPGPLEVIQGTSVASPLSAGFFALIASRVGCRLGDVHPTLYMLGNAQLDGGAQVFHDIVSGSATYDGVTGPRAAVGYDSVTGWGSIDVEALAEAWPPCPGDAGPGPGPAFDPCELLGCSGDSTCQTLTEGPSSCVASCDSSASTACGASNVCSAQTLFSGDTDAGVCVPGCTSDLDCGDGGACITCDHVCEPDGKPSAKIGDACVQSTDCPAGTTCIGASDDDGFFPNGYCTQPCTVGADASSACGCPAGSACDAIGHFPTTDICLQTCTTVGAPCGQSGYVCQPVGSGSACLPGCEVLTVGGSFQLDFCSFEYHSPYACNLDSGVCTVPRPDGGMDAGADGGAVDGGVLAGDAGTVQPDGGSSTGPSSSGHSSGCSTTGGGLGAMWGLAALAILLRRRRGAE